jgi:hypothetical protein
MPTGSVWRQWLVVAAGVGFVLSLLCNIVTRAGVMKIPQATFMPLFVGVFVVFFPTVLSAYKFQRMKGDWLGLKAWKYIGQGAPGWMRWAVVATFVYAFINFFTAASFASQSGPVSAEVFVVAGSGHTMLFYAACIWINYAAQRRTELGIEWACQRGHSMSPEDKFCTECGAPMKITQARGERV